MLHWTEITLPVLHDIYIYDIIVTSDVQYVSIYKNIDIFIQYRDTILAFGGIDTLVWAV